MTQKELIRQEIERLKTTNPSEYNYNNAEGYIWAMDDLLAFIDSLPEEKPSEDLEEAAAKYELENRQSIISSVDIVDAFIAGAEWMRKHSPLPEDTVLFHKGVEEGKRLMMEEAVEGDIVKTINDKLALHSRYVNLDKFHFGDKVRIIIV